MTEHHNDVDRLADALNGIAMLYQFRSTDSRLYGTLTVSQSYCLRTLHFNRARTMGELAAELRVRLSTITGVVNQLEEKKLVERKDNPHDRRSLHVVLTPQGRKLYGAAHGTFLTHIAPLLRSRSVVDREKFICFLAEITEAIRAWQSKAGEAART